ncbi:MAG TPA: DinB family protein [Thermoanaerobaculia bacterium]|nr:DinB family protein [Thermoanaerobaculia bacterium]
MRLVERTLLELNATFDGSAWHGTPFRRILDGVDEEKANARPLADAKTIGELLAHATAWIEIVQRRLEGEIVNPTPEEDFPSVEGVSWDAALARLDAAHTRLVDTVARMSDSDFDDLVPGKSYDAYTMIQGVMHHSAYHSAQIVMLKKM